MQRPFLLPAFLFFVFSAPPETAAQPAEGANFHDTLKSLHLKPRQELILQRTDGAEVQGRFIRLDEETEVIQLRRFIPAEGRIRTDPIPFGTMVELRSVTSDPSDRYPIFGTLIGMGLGTLIGFIAGETHSGGDVGLTDTRPLTAGIGGLLGAPFGLVIGAVVAPNRRTETVLWPRDHK